MQVVHERAYPQLMDEVRGLAAGSGLDFRRTMLNNMAQELGQRLPAAVVEPQGKAEQGCTDFHCVGPRGARGVSAWGHNEDAGAGGYIVHCPPDEIMELQ